VDAPNPRGTRAPLADIRVCDVTQNLAGPFCAQILADLGATVIKVEPPGGDLGRLWGPPFWGEDSTLFLSANRGKRSIVLDLKQEAGMDVLRRIATSCDVFVQASRPAASRRLGIDAASVRAWREDIVHMSLSAYGQDGPMSEQPGYDPLMQAYAGIISVTGEPGGAPTRVGGSVVDFGTGMWAALSILAALRERDRSGAGAALEASLMDTSLAWVSYHMMGFMATGRVPGPMGSSLGAIAPYRAFRTSDGHVMIAAGNDAIFSRLCTALDLPELAEDPRFVSNPERVAHRAELDPLVEGATGRLTTEELLRRAKEHSIPASAIQSIDEVVDDPQVEAAGMFPSVVHPAVDGYRDVSLPLRMDGARPRAEGVPPARGEHSVEILEELGFDGDEIETLLETGTVSQGDRPRSPRETRKQGRRHNG
jgi:crotonobetainyl-CoA:carnitine CoA-transferase CaiB-like acyl-CoA transferase